MNKLTTNQMILSLGGIASFTVLGVVGLKDYHSQRILKLETQYPDSYWESRASEAKAKVETVKAKLEQAERLEIDKRERETWRQKERIEFEKNAPDGYWEAQKAKTQADLERHKFDEEKRHEKDERNAERRAERERAELLSSSLDHLARAVSD